MEEEIVVEEVVAEQSPQEPPGRLVEVEAQLRATEALLRRYRVLELAQAEALRLDLNFASGALGDAYSLGLLDDVPLESEEAQGRNLSEALQRIAEQRPYLLRPLEREKPAAPNIDATVRGSLPNPLESAAARAAARHLLRGF